MSFSELPLSLKRDICRYIDHRSVVQLSKASRAFHFDVSLSRLSSSDALIDTLHEIGHREKGDIPIKGPRIPIFGKNPHTVLLKCWWHDQGWGNRKGRLFIVARSDNNAKSASVGDNEAHFEGGKVIYRSPIAPYSYAELKIAFRPRRNNTYHLFYVVGTGGGHELFVNNLRTETLGFEDQGESPECLRSIERAARYGTNETRMRHE